MVATLAMAVASAWACAEPPDKEMHQAQGAIDAARAAGAERYAPAELEAATTALARSAEAVAARDYRLALSQALEASNNAQGAARAAADQKALVRSETDRALENIEATLVTARDRLKTARAVRAAAAPATALDAVVTAATEAVQEARSALDRGDYLGARDRLAGVNDRLAASIAELDAAIGPRRRR